MTSLITAIEKYKLARRLSEDYGSPFSAEMTAQIHADREAVKPRFMQTDCAECKTMRPMLSWTKLSLADLAARTNYNLKQFYGNCYLIPTLKSHATASSVADRVQADEFGQGSFKWGSQPGPASHALRLAHSLLIIMLDVVIDTFGIDLKTLPDGMTAEFHAIWKAIDHRSPELLSA